MVETITVSKKKIGQVLDDVERLVSDVESLFEDQDTVVKKRLSEITKGKVVGNSEKDIDTYLKARGVKIE